MRAFEELVGEIGRPLNLAVFRITVALAVITSTGVRDAAYWSALPVELRHSLEWLPLGPTLVHAVQGVAVVAAVLAIIGLWSRAAMWVLASCAFVLLGIHELYGTPIHHHHLVWFALLVATSPCGDALSIDARRKKPPPRPALAYALPLVSAWLLIGMIYFFPGTWKLRTSGLGWIFSDNLVNQMRWKWYQHDWIPALRVDRYPRACQLAALGVVVFELAFLPALLVRRLRTAAVWTALLFHALSAIFLRIYFASLWACFTVFVDWERVFKVGHESSSKGPMPRAAIVVAVALLVGNLAAGVLGISSAWPFACYPTFEHRAGPEMPTILVEAVRANGEVVALAPGPPRDKARAQRLWGLRFTLTPNELGAYWQLVRAELRDGELPADTVRIRFQRALVSVDPDAPSRRPRPIGEIGSIAL